MGSKTASGESRLRVSERGRAYVESIIGCSWIAGDAEVRVPPDATHYIEEGGVDRALVTFYRWKSRPDLWDVPEGWRGRTIRFRYQL